MSNRKEKRNKSKSQIKIPSSYKQLEVPKDPSKVFALQIKNPRNQKSIQLVIGIGILLIILNALIKIIYPFTYDFILYSFKTNPIYVFLCPLCLTYGVYVLFSGEKQNKIAYLLIIGGVLSGYLIFVNPFTAFYTKPVYAQRKKIDCLIETNQLDQLSQTILKFSFSDQLLIFEGEKAIGKSLTFKKYADQNKNVIYFSLEPQCPSCIIDTLLSELGYYDYSDLPIPLLKIFGSEKKNGHLVNYLQKFPNTRINDKMPVIIIDNFDFLYSENEKEAIILLTAARVLLGEYQFIFVATEGYLSQNTLAHEPRIYFMEFPSLDEFERMDFAKCYLSIKCPDYQLRNSNISQYLSASFAINIRFLQALCDHNLTINFDEDLKLLLKKKTDLLLFLMMNFLEIKLNLFSSDANLLIKLIKRPILETIFRLIDSEKIPYDSRFIHWEMVKKDVFKIVISNGNIYLTFQTKFHKLLAEDKFGNKTSSLRREFDTLLKESKED